MKTIDALCKHHRRRSYFDDGAGLVGVYNHQNRILWYRWTVAGYSLAGSTDKADGATFHYLR